MITTIYYSMRLFTNSKELIYVVLYLAAHNTINYKL